MLTLLSSVLLGFGLHLSSFQENPKQSAPNQKSKQENTEQKASELSPANSTVKTEQQGANQNAHTKAPVKGSNTASDPSVDKLKGTKRVDLDRIGVSRQNKTAVPVKAVNKTK
jgi:hypothetical protein